MKGSLFFSLLTCLFALASCNEADRSYHTQQAKVGIAFGGGDAKAEPPKTRQNRRSTGRVADDKKASRGTSAGDL